MSISPIVVFIALLFSTSFVCAQNTGKDTVMTIDDKMFERVEVEADYPGGSAAWLKFLIKTVNGEVPTNNNAPAGTYTVLVQFIVNRDSSIAECKALTNHGYGMEQEVIRSLRLSGKWIPAVQNGKPVRAYRKQPVTFRVEQDGYRIETENPDALYLRKKNHVTVWARKTKEEDIQVTVSHGSVTKTEEGHYIIMLTKKDRVVIRLYNKRKDQEIGAAIYDVRE